MLFELRYWWQYSRFQFLKIFRNFGTNIDYQIQRPNFVFFMFWGVGAVESMSVFYQFYPGNTLYYNYTYYYSIQLLHFISTLHYYCTVLLLHKELVMTLFNNWRHCSIIEPLQWRNDRPCWPRTAGGAVSGGGACKIARKCRTFFGKLNCGTSKSTRFRLEMYIFFDFYRHFHYFDGIKFLKI